MEILKVEMLAHRNKRYSAYSPDGILAFRLDLVQDNTPSDDDNHSRTTLLNRFIKLGKGRG